MEIKTFSTTDLPRVFEFYAHAFGADLERKKQAFEWIQAGNPFLVPELNYVLMVDGDQLVGYWGRMPMQLYALGKPFLSVFSQEALVNPAYRGQGVASKLLAEVNGSEHLLVSLWHNEKIVSILRKGGWRRIDIFRPQKKIFKLDKLVRRRIGVPLVRQVVTGAGAVYLRLKGLGRGPSRDYSIRTVSRFGPEYDDFFRSVASSLGIIADRGSATLNWKYIDIPHRSYSVLAATKESRLRGYVVYRIHEVEDGIRKATIVDLLADPRDPAALAALVATCDRAFREEQADFSVCQVSTPAFRRILARQGYYQGGNVDINSLWIHHGERCPEANLETLDRWYFTFGDSDGEMW